MRVWGRALQDLGGADRSRSLPLQPLPGAAIRRILMPLVRVTMIKGKSPDYIKKMSDSIYETLVEAYQMTENDLSQIIEQLEPGDLIYDRHYGIKGSRSGDFVITSSQTRGVGAKRRPSWRVFRTNLLPRRELRVTMSSSVSP
jgi:Tautomerase enzyme